VTDGKLQFKHAPAAEKSDINEIKKKVQNIKRCRDSRSAKSRETR